MARRTMKIKRVDPWSVLKVGFLANLVLLGILLLAGRVVWFFTDRLELVTKACDLAESVGFTDCGLNGGNIFRNALLLGLLGVIVQTGILVFVAFLFNLISELTGGIALGVDDELVGTRPAAGPSGRSAGRSVPAEAITARGGAAAAPQVMEGGSVVGKVAAVAQKAGAAVASTVASTASSASDAAKTAAAKASVAREEAVAKAKADRTAASDAETTAAETTSSAPAGERPTPPTEASPRPTAAADSAAKASDDLFKSRELGPSGPSTQD